MAELAKSSRSSRSTFIHNSVAKRARLGAEAVESNPGLVDALYEVADAFDRLCRYHRIDPRAVDPTKVKTFWTFGGKVVMEFR